MKSKQTSFHIKRWTPFQGTNFKSVFSGTDCSQIQEESLSTSQFFPLPNTPVPLLQKGQEFRPTASVPHQMSAAKAMPAITLQKGSESSTKFSLSWQEAWRDPLFQKCTLLHYFCFLLQINWELGGTAASLSPRVPNLFHFHQPSTSTRLRHNCKGCRMEN